MNDVLIIFIDSLPYALLEQTPFLKEFPAKWAIEPGFGYSVNIHAELFAGLVPDKIGYFGEWGLDPENAPGRPYRAFLPLLDRLFHPYILNRGLQHLLTRRYSRGFIMPNIPLRLLGEFAHQGHHIQSTHCPYPTIFTQFPDLKSIRYREIDRPKGERDQVIVTKALALIPHHNRLFVPLPDLDGFGHTFGIEHTHYLSYLQQVDTWCRQLSEKFLEVYPTGRICVVSDHGMVSVDRGVHLDIEETIGPAGSQSYLYFSDANLLRVWVKNSTLHTPIAEFLEQYPYGRLVTDQEREIYGLTSAAFGDFIFVLHERLAFQPSTFARNIPRGMHGYHPQTTSQLAVALLNTPPTPGDSLSRMKDVHQLLVTLLA